MDREYLEDYSHKEKTEFEKLKKRIQGGRFSFDKDRFPSDERFVKLQEPIAVTVGPDTDNWSSIWTQIPFSGSLILLIPPMAQQLFEAVFFKVSEIPRVVDFIKEAGRLQMALNNDPLEYVGLDYMNPFFEELRPPYYHGAPGFIFATEEELQRNLDIFHTLASVKFLDYLRKVALSIDPLLYKGTLIQFEVTYAYLKAGRYGVAEEIENLLIDDPDAAYILLCLSRDCIIDPIVDLRSNLRNCSLEFFRMAQILPPFHRPQPRFPCEIGRFLMKKLTYAPTEMRACNELIDHYDVYDLQKVQESLNSAIVTNNPDIVNKNVEELSRILDNVWNDKTIPRKIKGLQIGIPLSMAAIGSVAAGPIGTIGGFLAGLGYSVADKLIDLETEGLSEKLAKLKTKSYQANVYDFKKKYKAKIAHS